jgi:hypothetical protein
MTDHEIEILEREARRPDRGGKYFKPVVVLALIAELKKRKQQGQLFDVPAQCTKLKKAEVVR